MIAWFWLVPTFLLGSLFGFAGVLGLIAFIGSLGADPQEKGDTDG